MFCFKRKRRQKTPQRFWRALWLLLVILLLAANTLAITKPEAVGMSSDKLKLLDALIAECLERKYFPGAVILVGRKDKVVFRQAYGYSQLIPEPKPMQA